MNPFELVHIREFGDGTAKYEARFTRPMTVRELIDYALARKRECGYLRISGNRILEYQYGKVLFDDLSEEQKDKTIKSMTWFGGYARADYCIKL